ncbi:hypothetical protein Patl1_32876 [Pistacia atlantica]|uniref:Uncharacterized protein n=1 Tax=Pistacia atlantica TaxID=434234 RepID=A0ACC1AQG0_9ROSI|nr:hypothetical protein Patl1_32876 [Pistacia atlantica]
MAIFTIGWRIQSVVDGNVLRATTSLAKTSHSIFLLQGIGIWESGLKRLSKLSNLKELNLGNNNFNNNILSFLAGVSLLKYFDLDDNRFKGVVNIEELGMHYNEIDQFVSPKGNKKYYL